MTVINDARTSPAGPQPRGPRVRRVPPNPFGIAFGLSRLGEAWQAAAPVLGILRTVTDAIYIVAAGLGVGRPGPAAEGLLGQAAPGQCILRMISPLRRLCFGFRYVTQIPGHRG